ncbi:EscU/YscU/HrcU family type III secretion system export apparatus switch protein [Rhodothermus profundi]|uniref:Flagellar biosynthetic protein FlhB n=1 Tax=Rhodothermus profundi TaxID=633813 RepID=A0A1M6X509_9BACT|nr:EscU/YscU/HrcU family type III secretion system export apparatus switch protein [Rhodothermus profundi]SHL00875.1 flagellar biosynthetic protein FlhB [Rhodothermus profundi]
MPDRDQKQFDPTPRRIQKAREEGNVFRSQETSAVLLLLGALLTLALSLPYAFGLMRQFTARHLMSAPFYALNAASIISALQEALMVTGRLLLPFFALLLVLAFGVNVWQTGWHPTLKPLIPKPERISPLRGLRRLFSSRGLFNVLKALLKIVIVGPIAFLVIYRHLSEILELHTHSLETILQTTGLWMLQLAAYTLGALLLLSIADFAYEKWKYRQDLKMTAQEVKDEHRETEGDPMVKSRRLKKARELLRRRRLDHAVLRSDVVVTNPTHYAVALRYDPSEAPAPRVMAKGIRKRALRIRALALEHGIPVVEDPPLARALYHNVPEEHEIPEELYLAVATILAEIYRQRGQQPPGATPR